VTQSVGRGTLLASRFRLEDLLGEASGARFWRATDLTLARSAALHVIQADDPRADRLLRAARLSAHVTEPRLLRVLDAAREDDVAYVVSEWGSGSSLDRLLADGALAPRRAAWMAREVADAIAHAHRQGVAHGRLIPENVMVTEAGSVKLIGFAVDAVLHGAASAPWEPGGYADDVRDLGAVLYAALVGRWPGTSTSRVPPAPRSQGRVLRARQVRAGVPRALDLLCDEVLNPADHPDAPATAAQVGARLADFLGDGAGVVPFGAPAGDSDAERTTVLDRSALPTGDGPPSTAEDPGADTAASTARDGDPDATQAGTPLFDDDGEGWAWADERAGERAGEPAGDRPTPRAAEPVRAPAPYTGMGAGVPPPDWGPDGAPEPPGPPVPASDTAREGRSWLRLAVAVATVLLLAVAVVVAFQLGRDAAESGSDGDAGASPTTGTRAVPVRAVSDFDPEADPPEENPADAALAVDGDPATSWSTVTYRGRPDLGGLKDGVGLLLDLGEEVSVSQVRATLVGKPYDLSLLVAPEGTTREPTDVGGLREVASASGVGPEATLAPESAVTTRYLVLWLTSLPPAQGGFQGRVAEIVVRS
jgi:hypothetical protein